MTSSAESPRAQQPYHHGDLRNALIAAALELARAGGPDAIVLREAARRVGVSATAAYRHFTALPQLVEAVTIECFGLMAHAMEAELARCDETSDSSRQAWDRMRAIGRGYVHFAVAEPGLFATAFTRKEGVGHVQGGTGESGRDPRELLEWALDGLLEVGSLAPADRQAAATHAWAVVHGLSQLLLGPMREMPPAERETVIESTLDLVGRGLLTRPPVSPSTEGRQT